MDTINQDQFDEFLYLLNLSNIGFENSSIIYYDEVKSLNTKIHSLEIEINNNLLKLKSKEQSNNYLDSILSLFLKNIYTTSKLLYNSRPIEFRDFITDEIIVIEDDGKYNLKTETDYLIIDVALISIIEFDKFLKRKFFLYGLDYENLSEHIIGTGAKELIDDIIISLEQQKPLKGTSKNIEVIVQKNKEILEEENLSFGKWTTGQRYYLLELSGLFATSQFKEIKLISSKQLLISKILVCHKDTAKNLFNRVKDYYPDEDQQKVVKTYFDKIELKKG